MFNVFRSVPKCQRPTISRWIWTALPVFGRGLARDSWAPLSTGILNMGPTIAVTSLKGGNGQNYGRRLFQDALYFTGHTNPKYGHRVEIAIWETIGFSQYIWWIAFNDTWKVLWVQNGIQSSLFCSRKQANAWEMITCNELDAVWLEGEHCELNAEFSL